MSVKEIQTKIDNLHYWDARVIELNCNYFADEIELIYEDEEYEVIYRFTECYSSHFNHVKDYNKLRAVKEMKQSQLPYFLQDVKVGEAIESGINFYTCKIEMFPLDVEIWCKNIQITKEKRRIKE